MIKNLLNFNSNLKIDNTLNNFKIFINDNIMIILIFIIVTITTFIIINITYSKKKKKVINEKPHNDPLLIHQNEIPTKEIIINKAFNLLTELEIAKMNLDLDKIKIIVSNNVFELYFKKINTLKSNKQKEIFKDIKLINSYITNIKNLNDFEIINLRITIECFNYILNSNNKIISGKYATKLLKTYEMDIKKSLNNENHIIDNIRLLYQREI